MTYEELKNEFLRLSWEDKQRFMEEVGFDLCKEALGNAAVMERMMPRCMEMMGQMPEAMRRRMQEWMTGAWERRR